jgi:type I restriction enzyme S subunit
MEVIHGFRQTEVGVFPNQWCVVRVGDLFKFKNGLNKAKQFFGHGSPIVNYMDVFGGPRLRMEEINGLVHVSRSELKAYEVRRGDVFFTRTSETVEEVGIAAVMLDQPEWTVWSGFVLRARPIDESIDDLFKAYCFSSRYFRQQVTASASYTTRALTNGRSLSASLLALPTLPEQRAISTALSDIDALIDSIDRLIAKKRDLKQAAMQQLLTGQTRLPGFSGEWEVKRLGDVGECIRGVAYKGDSDLSPHDTAQTNRLLRSNNVQNATVVIEDIQFVNTDRVSEKQLLRANDILICMANGSKALVGKAGLFNVSDGYDYTFGAFMGCFRSNNIAAISSFVFYLFQTQRYRNYIINLLAGSSINNLSHGSIESLEFQIPPIAEQSAISAVLLNIDAELASLENRRNKTTALKQGMMQELLTGRTRLV